MNPSITHDALTLPITQATIDRALRLARTQPPETAERAYRNAIAVLTAQDYCILLGFEADLSQSDALQPIACLTGDIATCLYRVLARSNAAWSIRKPPKLNTRFPSKQR
ncbi:MAG: DUF1822 family protein [Coleofasciculaceae cyanobacterium RL_1_1]|nr:DUF1822 family protein [Coleofasciculaceae cyanobacterium RL_1_1]